MLSLVRSRRAVWIALCAVLFAAMSSTLASLAMQDRADIMNQICSVSGLGKSAESGVPPGKQAKAVYCADCLNSSTWQTVAAPVIGTLFVLVAGTAPALPSEVPAVQARSVAPPPSRGPPAAI